MSVLAAMWCGPISDHSFFSVPPYFQVSDTWRGPGTTCVTSSWEILVSPVKLFAQEESWSLASMQGSLVLGCIRGRWASCESDRAAQESNSASQVGLAQCQASEWMRRGHHGVQASSPGLGTGALRVRVYWHPLCAMLCANLGGIRDGKSHLTMAPSCQKRKPSMDEKGRADGVGDQEKGCGERGLAGGEGLGEGNMREGLQVDEL